MHRDIRTGKAFGNFSQIKKSEIILFMIFLTRYGQLSGMVEPVAGLLGVFAVGFAQACLPYALSFAAGAMLYVVFENLMPEASSHGNSKLSTWCCMFGFCIMMSLDVGLN